MSRLVREVVHRSPLRRFFFPWYGYMMDPAQLCFLCECLSRVRDVEGDVMEIGCAHGATTVFLNRYLDAIGMERRYYCVDTFQGFVAADLAHEVEVRGKSRALGQAFRVNAKRWFEGTMRMNRITRVVAIERDVSTLDFSAVGPLAFCLLDVDLYRPMKAALPRLFERLSPGGILVADDVDASNSRWDGAYQAFDEFVREASLPFTVVQGKLGFIQKPRAPTSTLEVTAVSG